MGEKTNKRANKTNKVRKGERLTVRQIEKKKERKARERERERERERKKKTVAKATKANTKLRERSEDIKWKTSFHTSNQTFLLSKPNAYCIEKIHFTHKEKKREVRK